MGKISGMSTDSSEKKTGEMGIREGLEFMIKREGTRVMGKSVLNEGEQ
jgi:hypothetical protein